MILNDFSSILKTYHSSDYVQGTVIDNVDPLHKSRLRVSIPGMTDQLDKNKLPWYPMISMGCNSASSIPPVGTRVVLYYIDIYNSLVFGSIPSITAK